MPEAIEYREGCLRVMFNDVCSNLSLQMLAAESRDLQVLSVLAVNGNGSECD